jgi:hypothetical protein
MLGIRLRVSHNKSELISNVLSLESGLACGLRLPAAGCATEFPAETPADLGRKPSPGPDHCT